MEDTRIIQVRDAGQKDDTSRKLKEYISTVFQRAVKICH